MKLKTSSILNLLVAHLIAAAMASVALAHDMQMPGMPGHEMPGMEMPKGAPAPVDPNCPMAFPAQNLCATVVFSAQPEVGKEAKFQVEFRNHETGVLQDPVGEVGVFLWMQMMGHGSAPVTIAHTNDSGVYLVTRAFFVMRGPWDIHVTVKNPNSKEEGLFPVSL